MARADAKARLLMSTPCVGPVVSLTYASAIDDPGRFKSSKQVGAHFGMTPKKYQSGETDYTGSWFGWQAHGGYDCSGLVWRVFKLGRQPAGARIRGRTAAMMANEIPRSQRLHLDQVQAGDLVFFGPGRIWQRVTEARIVHVGIAMGNGWMINSSSQGVTVAPLFEDWRVKWFSFARRVL